MLYISTAYPFNITILSNTYEQPKKCQKYLQYDNIVSGKNDTGELS